jgi:hypothetical protein
LLSIKFAKRLLGYAWLCILAVALGFSAFSTDRKARQVEEYPFGSDPFCYLSIAQEIRRASAAGSMPIFTIEHPHTRMLVDFLRTRPEPPHYWNEMISPLAYHYFPVSNQVGVKCPPGAGILLSAFPEGKALHRLDKLVIGLFVTVGIVVLILAGIKQAWLSAGFVILALQLAFEILMRIENASFSINAMFAPMLLSGVCLAAALALHYRAKSSFWPSWTLRFLAGFCFGFAILVRLPIAFLLPGVAVLLWPRSLWRWQKSALLAFSLGVLLGGVVPIMIHQSRLTGAWYLPTYGPEDNSPPSLAAVGPNLSFYFGVGKPSEYNWALWTMAVGCAGLVLYATLNRKKILRWWRVGLGALLMWGLPMSYFLTHQITGHYYPLPSLFGTVLVLALGSFMFESLHASEPSAVAGARRILATAGFLLALTPGVMMIERTRFNYHVPTEEVWSRQLNLPAELADERAWVWADIVSGPLWYYARKPSHKVNFSSPELRMEVYKLVLQRGEPQFIIEDGTDMKQMMDEMVRSGAALEQRGMVDGYPYFLINWRHNGP